VNGEGPGVGSRRTAMPAHPWNSRPRTWQTLKPGARLMRRAPTPAELRLWQELRGGRLGQKFRRQHVLSQFIVDFYCSAAKLVVEVDGDIHAYQLEQDRIRQQFLEAHGFRFVRFTNEEVFEKLPEVLARI